MDPASVVRRVRDSAGTVRHVPGALIWAAPRAASVAVGCARVGAAGAAQVVGAAVRLAHGQQRPAEQAAPEARRFESAVEVTPRPPAPATESDLPVERWDERSPISLRPSVRTLDVEQLHVLLRWEREHAARPPVLTMLENRITKVSGVPPA